MKQLTPIRLMIDNIDLELKSRGLIINWDMYLEKEKQVIVDAVNETIDGYVYFTESTHNPPPMNGEDYYNNKYSK